MKTWIARNPGGVRIFAFNQKPIWARDCDGQKRWFSQDNKWIELPSTWCSDVLSKPALVD